MLPGKKLCWGSGMCCVWYTHMRTHGHAYEVCSSAPALLMQDGKCGEACAQSNTCGGEAVMTMAKDGRSVRLSARRALIECVRRSAPVGHPEGVTHAREMPRIAWNFPHPRAQLISLPSDFHHILLDVDVVPIGDPETARETAGKLPEPTSPTMTYVTVRFWTTL